MYDFLFSVPWWIPTVMALIGAGLFLNGNKTQVLALRNAGMGLIALAILWAVVSYLVDTDSEKVERGTRQLVQAVVDGVGSGDYKGFTSQLTPSALFTLGSRAVNGADNIKSVARDGAEMVKLRSAQCRDLKVEANGPYMTVHCDIFSTQESFAPIETSSWQFDWERTSAGWKVHEIKLLRIHDASPDQIDGPFPGNLFKPR